MRCTEVSFARYVDHFFSMMKYSYTKPARPPPSNGPTQYTQWFSQNPATNPGPNVRAGFMDAPVRGPPTRISTRTVSPIPKPPIFGARGSIAVPKTDVTN